MKNRAARGLVACLCSLTSLASLGCGSGDDDAKAGTGGSGTGGAAGGSTGTGGTSASGGSGGGTEPPIVDPNGPKQFLTWDGGSGPGAQHWNTHLGFAWKNKGGDWLDANQTPQGDVPYVTASVSSVGRVTLDVTTLVGRWLGNSENRGFFLRTDQAFPFQFVGRTATDSAQRPALEIKTDQGTFLAPPTANARWSPSSLLASDTRAAFAVDSSTNRAIVQFDLSAVKGKLESATLGLSTSKVDKPGTLRVFEADPPIFRVGGGGTAPTLGIAKGYPTDQGLGSHPSVLFAGDFSDMSAYRGQCKSTQAKDPATGLTELKGEFVAGELLSCDLRRDVTGAKGDGIPDKLEKALYARYYVYLEKDWGSTVDANKMPGWDLRFGWWNPASGGYWQATTGNGGSPGTGLRVWNATAKRFEFEGHSLRGHGGEKAGDGNYYDDLTWVGGYIYNLDQVGPYGEGIRWPYTVLSKERWFSIEQFVQVNSVTGPFDADGNGTAVGDGVYRVWVDGVQVFERTNFRWTRHPDYGLQGFWFNWYHGGTSAPTAPMHYRMNSLVIAREYIGPRSAK
ncbi:MAG: disaggregatase related repeat-containing protein [Polyangiaceae bacterium]